MKTADVKKKIIIIHNNTSYNYLILILIL